MNNLIVTLVVIVGLLGGFYVGARYGQAHPVASVQASPAASGAGARNGGTGSGTASGATTAGSAISGRITAVNGNTITILDRATNKDVKIDVSSARITKTAQGSLSDLTTDTTVTVVGQPGAGGTVDARIVSVGGGFGAGQGGRGRPAASPSPGG